MSDIFNKKSTTLARLLISRLISISSRAKKEPDVIAVVDIAANLTAKAIAVSFASLKYDCGLYINSPASIISIPILGG